MGGVMPVLSICSWRRGRLRPSLMCLATVAFPQQAMREKQTEVESVGRNPATRSNGQHAMQVFV